MTYNAHKPKTGVFFKKIKGLEVLEVLYEMSPYRHFYGTDSENNRTTYLDSISNEMRNQILKPAQTKYASFFKPFSSVMEGTLNGIYAGGTIYSAVFTPYYLIPQVCLFSALELITAFISLCKGIYETTKGDHPAAAEYYLDATTRAALILPLLVLNTVIIPLDVISFFTRSIVSLVDCARGIKPSASNRTPEVDGDDMIPNPA